MVQINVFFQYFLIDIVRIHFRRLRRLIKNFNSFKILRILENIRTWNNFIEKS